MGEVLGEERGEEVKESVPGFFKERTCKEKRSLKNPTAL
jgi:hypothetical protein